ncbi:MAG: ATP-dependent DNA helicase RecG [Bacteroidia bacterium]|nr:ATP-dependent DNA helicase RecG [Bacteroidia bacterium]
MPDIWRKEITYLKKVGPVRADVLAKELNIKTYGDLLHYYPRKYVDRSRVSKISGLTGQEPQVVLVGKITALDFASTNQGKGRLRGDFTDGSGFMELVWFQGAKWIQKNLKLNEEIAIYGKPTRYGGSMQITHPEIDYLQSEDGIKGMGIVPYYSSNDKLGRLGLDSRGIRGIVYKLLEESHTAIQETLPAEFLAKYQLLGRRDALTNIHFPKTFELLQEARRRLIFEELFFFQLMLARRRKVRKTEREAPPFDKVGEYFHQFFEHHMPFELTGAQKRVLKEIRRDLARPVQMNRLVQGDVGSGKTMVAFMSMLIAKDNGYQSAMMAPTAILAEQHLRKISHMAAEVGITVDLIVGGQRAKERREVLARLASGETDIIVGTHALIEDPVIFQRLGFVVVDEQHKFGVMQRGRLFAKGNPFPHNMIMTATPIPRTLAMSLYGDVDVSVIDELPPGRKPIDTLVVGEKKRLEVLGFIRKELEKGRQAYVVYPLVEESEKLDYLAAVKGHELLERYFKGYRVGIVHGRQAPEDKELEMKRFVKNETQILVSTTVIEVGVDVPNSSVMLIENAERFGLSQLHQLRGRVGRGAEQSYCLLMAGAKVSDTGRRRLEAMRETNDGFRISEIDLELRGPGDFLGTRQSGLPEFTIANIVEDRELLELARQAAFDLVERDPLLQQPEHQMIQAAYRKFVKAHQNLVSVA